MGTRSTECRHCIEWKETPRAVKFTTARTIHYIPAMWLAGRVFAMGTKVNYSVACMDWVTNYSVACMDWVTNCHAAARYEAQQAVWRANRVETTA